MAAEVAQGMARRRRVFHSVFSTDQPLSASTLQAQSAQSQSAQSHSQPRTAANDQGHIAGGCQFHEASTYSLTATTSFWTASPLSQPTFSRGMLSAEDETDQLATAWNIVTSILDLDSGVPLQEPDGTSSTPEFHFVSQTQENGFSAALVKVLQAGQLSHGAGNPYDILAWHSHQVRAHFIDHEHRYLARACRRAAGHVEDDSKDVMDSIPMAALQRTVQHLHSTFRQYFARLTPIIRAIDQSNGLGSPNSTSHVIMTRFTHDINALVADAAGPILPVMRAVFGPLIEQTLQMTRAETRRQTSRQPSKSGSTGSEDTRERLLQLVEALNQVGMAGESFQVLFAELMDEKMSEYIHQSYARVWRSSSKFTSGRRLNREAIRTLGLSQVSWCILSLCDWIENSFARLALEVLSRVEKTSTKPKVVSLADVQQWKEIGIGRIAALRTSELFDIVLEWPASKGALDDLKASVTTPQRRWQLTEVFSSALQNRLLHPARSTLDILRVYISMIRAFHALDHSKVLLGRVVPSLQLYLVQREDAVRIVVTGLLASPEEVEAAEKSFYPPSGGGAGKKLVELAVLLNDPDQQRRTDVDEDDLDWDDMNWVPDPVDAGINYRRPKSEDVIGTLISTLGSEEVFIKEFQNIISEHLLSNQTDFAQEQRVLDLLQKRFSESALQNCEVMIKDIYDSRKVDTRIRRVQLGQPAQPPRAFGTPAPPPTYIDMGRQLDLDEEERGQVPYHARILSRLYWPDIVQETFNLPRPVAQQQERYETGYERLKTSRKLTWLHQLGQATVELELEDRTINIECKTFEAAVIYAFQDDEGEQVEGGARDPTRRTVRELQEMLQMDEELVLQALETWELEGVIARCSTTPDAYVVLERKDSPLTRPGLYPSASAPAALEGEHQMPGMPPKPSGVKRAGTTSAMDAKENERRAMYWQFIVGMLTNSMPMVPLGRMASTMRLLIPDGFSWSDQELQEFLAEKMESGELELVGANYKLAKK